MTTEDYTVAKEWRDKVQNLENNDLLNLFKQINPDSMNSIEYNAMIFLRGEVLYRMMEPRPPR